MTAVLCYSHHCFYFSSVFSQDDGLFPVALEGLLLPFHSREHLAAASFHSLTKYLQKTRAHASLLFSVSFALEANGFFVISFYQVTTKSCLAVAASELSGSSTASTPSFYLDRILKFIIDA
ncbi:hypothetical protein NC653_038976 [Populus alba x Populus x berolinensis]|uniref:Uncharacterized protein n=1 Tax=Populus alba x Populus x berolinensis TaxID=444605 RepID=A0AAD6LA38_9ROSI|nr:hypothetical protein NC653_038976 [Populus alba x Populus x berolinensis]